MIYRRSVVVRQGTSFASHRTDPWVSTIPSSSRFSRSAFARAMAQVAVVIALLVLGGLNISVKNWTEMDDGWLWVPNGVNVVATVVAKKPPAERAGIRAGDAVLEIEERLLEY